MKSSPDENTQYQQLLAKYPPQQANGWRWIDTRAGASTLILLPGFMGEAETSFLFIQSLAPHARIISVSYPASIGQVNALGESFSKFLDEMGIQQAAILGGSSSGFLAQAFLRQIPTRISACILTHTGLPGPRRARAARFYLRLLQHLPFGPLRWLMQTSIYTFFPRSTPTQAFWRAHFREIIGRQTQESLSNRFALMHDFHAHHHFQPDDLSAWPGKILLMEMTRDHLTHPAEQAAMRSLYPNARLHIFAETAHYDLVEQPGEQIRAIQSFLTSLLTAE